MQVEELPVTAASPLRRTLKIVVDNATIEQNIAVRLAEIGKTAKLDGFRPGKVPMPVLAKRYGEAIRDEVVEKTAKQSVEQAISERQLRPAMAPEITLNEAAPDAPMSFTVDFEVLPEVTPGDFTSIQLDKPTAAVANQAIDDMITRMAKSSRQPQPLAPPRAAQTGDVLLIDFAGSTEGKAHDGMQGKDHKLELGSNSFIPGFEDQLLGSEKGAVVTVSVTFPSEYHAAELAGKPAEFVVTVKDILVHQPLLLDDALAGDMGFATFAELRTKVAERMQAEHDGITRDILRRQLLDQLAEQYDFPVPEAMVEAEFGSIWEQVQQEKARGTIADEDANKDEATQRDEYRTIAERRVRLGLLLAEVGRQQNLKVEQNELRDALIAETRRYPGQEQQVFEYFTKTPGALDRLRAPILEDKVMDFVINQTQMTARDVTIDELRALPDQMDEAAEAKLKASQPRAKKSA